MTEIFKQSVSFGQGMSFVEKIDMEFLENLNADGRATGLLPSFRSQRFRDETFRRFIQPVATEKDVCIEKTGQRAWL